MTGPAMIVCSSCGYLTNEPVGDDGVTTKVGRCCENLPAPYGFDRDSRTYSRPIGVDTNGIRRGYDDDYDEEDYGHDEECDCFECRWDRHDFTIADVDDEWPDSQILEYIEYLENVSENEIAREWREEFSASVETALQYREEIRQRFERMRRQARDDVLPSPQALVWRETPPMAPPMTARLVSQDEPF